MRKELQRTTIYGLICGDWLAEVRVLLVGQIAGLLKDNEKIQATPEVPPSDDDTELKKIKKVSSKDERTIGEDDLKVLE